MVFVNHGDDSVCNEFTRSLQEEFQIPASAPYSGSVYDLIENRYDVLSEPIPIGNENKSNSSRPPEKKMKSAYLNLLDALERLSALIRNGSGRSNGELKKVTEQLNKISDKWELP